MESERASLNPPKEDAKKPKNDKVMTVGYFALFKYATSSERIILALAILMSCGHGAMMPVFSIIFGDVTSDFTADKTADQRRKQASETALKMFYVGLGTLAAAFLASFFWNYIGQKINLRVRKLYFHAMSGQEMGWFDEMNPETMTTRYVENMHKFSGAVGQRNHVFIYATAMTFSGFIIGFVSGWWYALIVTLSFPIIMIGMVGFVTIMAKESQVTKESYEKAGGNAEQAFRAIKTVKILSGEEHELNIYKNAVEHAKKESMKFGMLAGLSFGFFFAAVFVAYGLNYWLGSVLVDKNIYNHNKKRDYNVADVVTIFFAVIMGGFAIGNTSPAAKAIGMGRVAAYEIYQILDRVSKIPLDDPNGIKPDSIDGDIEFKNIHFKYPTRKETPVLQGLNLIIPKGKKVALVGETGCGKSTTIQLLERYYDPDAGTVTIDGKDIRSYNLIALRKFIGYVGQEPVLFAGSIRENLLLAKPTATEDQMIEALKQANAYSFVVKLEKGIDSYVGAGGSQLSGGQKQRIAIARSILQNPRILLLDEATSALDRRNEKEIQQTLDYFAKERTTVTIAHRLSTVMNSDIIYVLEKGQVIEAGNHHELVAKNGFYAKLVSHQLAGTALDEPGMSRKTSVDPAQIHLNKHISAEAEPEDPQKENGDDKEEVKKSDELTFEEKIALKKEEKMKAKKSKKRLNRYLEGNYFLLIIGCIFSLASGALMPIFALLMADMIEVLSKFDIYRNYYHYDNNSPQWQDLKKEALYIGGYYLIMAGVSLITNFFQIGTFHVMGQRITTRLRTELYEHFLTRDMEFFDDLQNSPGDLSTVLAKDCLTVNTIVSTSYGAILNALGSFACGITISMIASWRLCLVALSVSPMIVVAGVIESKLMQPPEIEKTETRESKTFQEVCTNMRTVNSLNAQPFLYERFYNYVVAENDSKTSSSIIRGIVYGLGQFAMFAVYALTFYAGAEFTVKYDLQFRDLFRSLFAIIFAAFGAGMGQQFAGNIGEAETASKKIFDYLDIKNKITYSAQPYTGEVKGKIELRNVKFTYPQRKQACFKDLSLTIEPKQKVAFAGPSGTGKSTIFSLLYRFYDVDSGEILLDGVNIKDYDIKHLRSSLGTVSQEPVLFNNSIRYNIKYNQPLRTDDEMVEAATIANAMKFIGGDERIESPVLQVSPQPSGDQSPEKQKLKQDDEDGYGFDRNVGERGSKLSGGQKQRVAIARTVIRRPQIYMFDESTSALDTQSERIVQDALNKISEQNTSLAIAHRIATIKDSDVIFVIEGGKVVEKGTYKQLIDMKGAFYQLNKNH